MNSIHPNDPVPAETPQPTPGTGGLSGGDASGLCGRHEDTIRRARKANKLPNSYMKDGQWFYMIGDLVNAGLLESSMAAIPAEEVASRGRAERRIQELERHPENVVGQLDAKIDEIKFLRAVLVNQTMKEVA